MHKKTNKSLKIALIGGGPAAMFMFKRLLESGLDGLSITVFERKSQLGSGMPYSHEGASAEHVTNVSGNEIPPLVTTLSQWIQELPSEILETYKVDPQHFHDFKVIPRLLFGQYLEAQFNMLKQMALDLGVRTEYYTGCNVDDVRMDSKQGSISVIACAREFKFDKVILCTGHNWPKKWEGSVLNYFDSPYPPQKLKGIENQSVGIRGASLTAIDAVRTLARNNGVFEQDGSGKLHYKRENSNPNFHITLHSRNGLLPAVRFHLEDSHLQNDSVLSHEEILKHREANQGFVSLDYIFEHNFKQLVRQKDPNFYEQIKPLSLEDFVARVLDMRGTIEPFALLRAEYAEAAKSIRRHQSIYWKEALAILSFSMNFPAKYFSAEDMLRLQKHLMPLISLVIAFIPQRSCEELMALHDAGVLDLVAVGSDSTVEPSTRGGANFTYHDQTSQLVEEHYEVFVDCIGQPHLSFDDFSFQGLKQTAAVSPARLRFQFQENAFREIQAGNNAVTNHEDGAYLAVPGVAINDYFQPLDQYGAYNDSIFIMAVPYIGGFNPDYSGLDFCEEASCRIIEALARQ